MSVFRFDYVLRTEGRKDFQANSREEAIQKFNQFEDILLLGLDTSGSIEVTNIRKKRDNDIDETF